MLHSIRTVLALTMLSSAGLPVLGQTTVSAPPTPAPPDAQLYFIAPQDGARIRGPFAVQFGLRNMGVAPAGVTAPNAGHHHILIDVRDPIDIDEPIPADRSHVHFGGGQTETRLDLAPGRHTLQLVLGDAGHRPFRPLVASDKIEITVLDAERPKRRPRVRRPRYNRY